MPLVLPDYSFRAYLFDCDGTIADSMPLHFLAWNQALARHNCPFPEELFYAWGGRPVPEIIAQLNRDHGLKMNVNEVAREKEDLYLELLPQVTAVPDVLAEIHRMHGKIPFAVVSGSPRDSVVKTLNALGILDLFETLVCAGEYTHGKPSPEPFLMAAERLNVPPRDCLVFEDADLGIQAAAAAGMQSVKIAPPGRG
jgi:HAD superfamily hydrolase (TIGR01509 family)